MNKILLWNKHIQGKRNGRESLTESDVAVPIFIHILFADPGVCADVVTTDDWLDGTTRDSSERGST